MYSCCYKNVNIFAVKDEFLHRVEHNALSSRYYRWATKIREIRIGTAKVESRGAPVSNNDIFVDENPPNFVKCFAIRFFYKEYVYKGSTCKRRNIKTR